jgi:hypothetical protein
MATAGPEFATGLTARLEIVTVTGLGMRLGSFTNVSVGHARQFACTDWTGPAKTTSCELKGVTDCTLAKSV